MFRAWRKFKVEWSVEFPKELEGKDPDALDTVRDLMPLDIGILYRKIEASDKERRSFGYIPRMACRSIGQLGALNAESFCERVLSNANLVMTDGNTLLSDEELEMLVILRMNRDFMIYMREHYNHLTKDTFGRTVVSPDE